MVELVTVYGSKKSVHLKQNQAYTVAKKVAEALLNNGEAVTEISEDVEDNGEAVTEKRKYNKKN